MLLKFMKTLAIKPQVKYAEVNKTIAALDEKIARAGYYQFFPPAQA
jgi:hypothetical protein